MIDALRGRYDRIFIDSPLIGAVSDSLHLLPKVDGVLYVVRYNTVNLRHAVACLGRLRRRPGAAAGRGDERDVPPHGLGLHGHLRFVLP
jgi:hypothetical protein